MIEILVLLTIGIFAAGKANGPCDNKCFESKLGRKIPDDNDGTYPGWRRTEDMRDNSRR